MHKGSMRAGVLLFLEEMERLHGGMSYRLQYREITWPGYPEKTWLEILGRMIEDGELNERQETIGLTRLGKARVYALQPARIYLDKEWDGRWRMVTFEIPEKLRVKRNQLRNLLTEIGFGMWQRSLYIHPYPMTGFVEEYAQQLGVNKYLTNWEAEITGKGKNQELVETVFAQEKMVEGGEKLLNRLNQMKTKAGSVLERERRKWMKHWQQYVFVDPLLPEGLKLKTLEEVKLKLLERVERMVVG